MFFSVQRGDHRARSGGEGGEEAGGCAADPIRHLGGSCQQRVIGLKKIKGTQVAEEDLFQNFFEELRWRIQGFRAAVGMK